MFPGLCAETVSYSIQHHAPPPRESRSHVSAAPSLFKYPQGRRREGRTNIRTDMYSAPMHMSCKLRLGNAIVQEWVSRPFRTRTNCEFRLRHVCVGALMATKFGVSTSLFESGSVLLASQASSNSCLSLEVPIPWGIRTPYVVMGAPRQPFLHNLIVSHAMMQLTRSSETWTSNTGL